MSIPSNRWIVSRWILRPPGARRSLPSGAVAGRLSLGILSLLFVLTAAALLAELMLARPNDVPGAMGELGIAPIGRRGELCTFAMALPLPLLLNGDRDDENDRRLRSAMLPIGFFGSYVY